MELCRRADRVTEQAKSHALKSIDGDQSELLAAKECRAAADSYIAASKCVDELRFAIERGDFS